MTKKVLKKQPTSETKKTNSYSAEDIYVLEGLEPVQKRPGMYIGSTGEIGLHHLIWEVVDNSIDEAMAGFAKNITIELLPGNQVSVLDDGRGIPVEMHKQTKKSALETVMTTLHAGGKFGGESYKVAGGLHGVGVSVVNALSERLRVEVCREGGLYVQEYERGLPKAKVKKAGICQQTGTKVIFSPDPQVFKEIDFNGKRILDHLRQQAYLTKGIRINITDRRPKTPQFYGFYFEGGLLSFVRYLSRNEKQIQEEIFYIHKDYENVNVETAFLYIDDLEVKELSFANNIYTPDGGMHLTGFRSALTRSLNVYARSEGYLKEKEENLTSDDVKEGLVVVVSVKLREPQFEGQTKARLGNPEARTAVEGVVGEALKVFLEKRPPEARRMIEKVLLAAKARRAAKAARDTVLRKGALEGLTLPGKLADCSSKDPAESELFIVEGDSAGGCFSGDTRVALVDGRNLSFKELVIENKQGKKNFCYTIQEDSDVGVAPIVNPRATQIDTEVIKVVLDNSEEIICTPNHKFMLANGGYKEARDLTPNDSLMPLYRKHSKIGGKITIEGYEIVFDKSKNYWVFTHLLSDAYNLGRGVYSEKDGSHRHHQDFNKLNNNPDNIIRMGKDEHLDFHRRLAYKTLHRLEVIEKMRLLHKTPEFREKIRQAMLKPEMRALLSLRAKKQWEDENYKEFMVRRFLEFYQNNSIYREKNNQLLNQAQNLYWSKKENRKAMAVFCRIYKEKGVVDIEEYDQVRKVTNNKSLIRYGTILTRFFDGDQKRFTDAVLNYNHKIKFVERLDQKIDVYDLEVPGTHNFALAAGVFVHNSAKGGRERRTQAILPLRGKILNVEKTRLDKMLSNQEIRSLVVAIGTAIADEFDLSKIRYHKVIIMTDADVDGAHIRTLLLTLFYRYFRAVIEAGYLYIAQPPLYRFQSGREARYVYTEGEKEKVIAELQKIKSQSANRKAIEEKFEDGGEVETISDKRLAISIQRYKGLGEMNPDQLWETTMNPENRLLKQVAIEDATEADRLFDVLMGDEVAPRRKFIELHALNVKNLDV